MKSQAYRPAAVVAAIGSAVVMPAAHTFAAGAAMHTTAKTVSKTLTFKGPIVEMMRWGPIQATIKVRNKRIVDVLIAGAPDNPRSEFIQTQAAPLLRTETLKAQSANIDEISGATDMSDAYIQSLQGAIKKAKQHRALK